MALRKIICYGKGCNAQAEWKVPGHPVLYLCTQCFKKLFPKVILPERVEIGPSELKENQDVENYA